MKTKEQNIVNSPSSLVTGYNNNQTNPDSPSAKISLNSFVYQEYLHTSQKGKSIHFSPTECFYMIYCWSGGAIFFINGKQKRIRSQDSCIIYDSKGDGIFLDFLKTGPSKIFVMCFKRPEQEPNANENKCFFKFKQVFSECSSGKQGYYIGKTNLEVFDKINSLTQMGNHNAANEFILEGMLFHIYGLKMIQMMEDQNGNKQYGGFTCREMEQLQSISQYIAANPGKEYTVEYLCRKTGLGPNKLQKGFKNMHKRTIIDYIRNIRLERAVELIGNSNMSITEIVYSVGLSSRSYFSKIFKRKYKISPKHYQQLQKETQANKEYASVI